MLLRGLTSGLRAVINQGFERFEYYSGGWHTHEQACTLVKTWEDLQCGRAATQ